MQGKRLGSYEVLGQLGAGGMGEVYLARDTRLDRRVAVKVLPAEFAADPERLARLEREAKLLASLNHPNIAAVHGYEEHDGTRFIAMELVEGPTLAERLEAHGALPVDEVAAISRQIAEALEAAHDAGIIHRDLKPANIKLTQAGKVKVLDFGLAKASPEGTGAAATARLSHSPTLLAATGAGVIMGTAAYMSPEQARGLPLDKRTDIWAFGCILYELLTGRPAFAGGTVTDILAAIVTSRPDLGALPPATPPALRALLGRTFEKDPALRLRDIGEARVALDPARLQASGTANAIAPMAALPSRRAPGWIWTALLVAAVALTAAIAWLLRPAADAPTIRASIDLPAGTQLAFGPNARPSIAVSPDGTAIAFSVVPLGVGVRSKNAQGSFPEAEIWVRRLDEATARRIEGTDGGTQPAFSLDGQRLAFFAQDWLMQVPLSGGAPTRVVRVRNPWGIDWAYPRGIVISWPRGGREMLGLANLDEPGSFVSLSRLADGDRLQDHSFPWHLSGDDFLITGWGGGTYADSSIAVLSTDTGETRIVQSGGSSPAYVPPGFLVYASGEQILGVPFDAASREIAGTPTVIARDVLAEPQWKVPQMDISRSGTLAYAAGTVAALNPDVLWVDAEGATELLYSDTERHPIEVELSPDGSRLAMVAVSAGNVDAYVHEIGTGSTHNVTSDPAEQTAVKWSATGDRLIYRSSAGRVEIYERGIGEAIPTLLLAASGESMIDTIDVSPDGRWLILRKIDESTGALGLYGLDLEAPGSEPAPLLGGASDIVTASFSPDGQWLAYLQVASGSSELWITRFPPQPGSLPVVIAAHDALMPLFWSRDGSTLYFNNADGLLGAQVDFLTEGTTPRASPRTPVLAITAPTLEFVDVAPDGRFLALRYPDTAAITRIEILTNVGAHVRRLIES